jgi:mycothiol system anti-sigma-R factor
MDCKEVGDVIFLFFDNELDDSSLSEFQEHVQICGHCSHRIDYTRKLMLILRRRCVRCAAPRRLRRRILISLPHRRGSVTEV